MDGSQVRLAGGTAIDSGSCQVLTIAHAHGGVVLGVETEDGLRR